jgi:DNA-binding MarR family transcriptional regulator
MPIDMRPSQALKLWHDVSLAIVRENGPDLSPRQITGLLTVYLEPPPHTVRGLAEKLVVTKPAITRALDALGELRLLGRRRDEADRRNVIVHRTVEGSLYLEKLADLIVAKSRDLPR